MASIINAATSGGLISTADTSGILQLQTASTTAVTVDASQNVGIGTSSPAYKLSVNGNAGFTGSYISFNDYSYIRTDVAGWFTMQAGSNGYQWRNSANSATAQMVLDSSGNLGLGVTPSAWSTASSTRAMQFPGGGTVWGQNFGGSNPSIQVACNAYLDAVGYKYFQSTFASQYQQNAGTHAWQTAASGTAGNAITFTEVMTLTAAGNLGVGTTSPINNSGYGGFSLNGTSGALLSMMTNGTESSRIVSIGNETSIQSKATTGFITFVQGVSGGTERARIDTSGNLIVGTNSVSAANERLRIYGSNANWISIFENVNANPYGNLFQYSVTKNGTGNEFLGCYEGGGATTRLTIRSNGGIANYSGNNVNLSDRREKTNIAPAKSYLDTICAIPVQTFNYIDQNMEEDGGLTLGVVAQDVQAVAPELVMESNWAKKDEEPKMRLSIYQTDLQYALMKALQELKAEFDAYKASHP